MGAVCPGCDDEEMIARTGDDEDTPLAGRWISGRGQVHIIGLHAIQWHSGDVTGFRKHRMRKGGYRYIVDLNGSEFTATMTPEGDLRWSDGDVWKRDTAGPRTGTYAALSEALAPAGDMLRTATSFVTSPKDKGAEESPGNASTDVGTPTPAGFSVSDSPYGTPPSQRAAASPMVGKNLFGTPETFVRGQPQPMSQVSTQFGSQYTQFPSQFSTHTTYSPAYAAGTLPPGVPMSPPPLMQTAPGIAAAQTLPVDVAAASGVAPRPKRRLAPPPQMGLAAPAGATMVMHSMPDR